MPLSPIRIHYGFVVHICKIFRSLNYSLKNWHFPPILFTAANSISRIAVGFTHQIIFKGVHNGIDSTRLLQAWQNQITAFIPFTTGSPGGHAYGMRPY
jgi:hypothetical protein